jgi:Iap family predicted aminopeptidase
MFTIFIGKENPLTPRVLFIIETLIDLKLHNKAKLNSDIFDDINDKEGKLKYVNIELTIEGNDTENSIMFTAHHDVNNPNSDNCQDNSASVCNLISLAEHFANNKPNKTVHIVFTDCEEFGGKGAKRLSERVNNGVFGNVESIVNLELTANGTNYWSDALTIKKAKMESELLTKINEVEMFVDVATPFSDSWVFRRYGIDSVCIGSLTDDDMQSVLKVGYCKTWALCHKEYDSIESASAKDMDKFVELLIKLA